MTRQVEAVYENGALRPLEPLGLREGEKVTVTVQADAGPPPKCGRELSMLFQQISASANLPPDDDFSGQDHDKILYGWEKNG